jgi:DNA helicase-2/ATP-dependent DNA helicase PcrA
VYLLSAVDGCLPSDMAAGSSEELEEERRLLYVAMTRAREELRVIVPQRFYVHQQTAFGDRHVYGGCTRFIPAQLFALFETVSWPNAASQAAARARHGGLPRIDLAERMRAMWEK